MLSIRAAETTGFLLVSVMLLTGLVALGVRTATSAAGAPTGPYHIPTWAYDEYRAGGASASAADVVRLVTYAETGLGNNKALSDCHSSTPGCQAVWYVNPNRIFDTPDCPSPIAKRFLAAAQESWFVHQAGYDDEAHRLVMTRRVRCGNGASTSMTTYQVNVGSPDVQAYFKNLLQTEADGFDLYLMDDTHASVINQYGGCGPGHCHRTQEIATDSDVQKAAAGFVNFMQHRNGAPMDFVFNSLSFNGRPVADVRLLDASSHFIGGVCEGCVSTASIIYPENYQPILNTMAAFNVHAKIFVLLSNGNAPPGSPPQVQQRLVTTALVWLGIDHGRAVAWPNLEYNTTNLAVWPEDMIYPSQPVQSMSSGAVDLQVAPLVWRREFTSCYLRGNFFGQCAAILNGGAQDLPISQNWLRGNYSHVVAVQGGDELSGGTVSVNSQSFVPNQTVISAGSALLLAQ